MHLSQLSWIKLIEHVARSVLAKRRLLAIGVALMGIVNGLTVLLPSLPGRRALLIALLNQIAPFTPSVFSFIHLGSTTALILGFYLLILASGLARGKRHARLLTLIILPLTALAHLAKGLDVEEAAVAMLLWFALFVNRSAFYVESDPYRLRQGLILLLVGFGLILVYSMVGYYMLQAQFTPHSTFGSALRSSLRHISHISTHELAPITARANWFINSIPWLSLVALLTGMFFLLRPVSTRWWTAFEAERLAEGRARATDLLYRFGSQAHSFFAFAPDNLRHLAPGGEGVVPYRLIGNVAVVLGDPLCAPQSCERVMQDFLDLCRREDWRVAIFQARPVYLSLYRALGLRAFKIGEEALLNPQSFTLAGSAMANVRCSCRRAERDGISISWYEGVPPEMVLQQLRAISSSWLEHKAGSGTAEMGFSLGRLDELTEAAARADAIAERQVAQGWVTSGAAPRFITAVAAHTDGRICAFATFTPIYGTQTTPQDEGNNRGQSGTSSLGWGWALDIMRKLPDAPPGVIELLLARSIERFRQQGAEVVSLGVVALADTNQEMSGSQRQIASFLAEHLRLLETHRSLWRFKQKFHPRWESRYVVASSTLALPKVALAILKAHLA